MKPPKSTFQELRLYITPTWLLTSLGNAEPIQGDPAHAALMKQMFSIFPGVHVDNDPYPVQRRLDNRCVPRHRNLHGKMAMPDGKVIPPTGKAFDVDFARTARWEGDLLIEEYVFWDSALQAQQIGLMW